MANEDAVAAIKARSNPAEESSIDEAFLAISAKLQVNTIDFSSKEQQILDLYDALKEMRLENALMEGQIKHGGQIESEASAEALEQAQREHLQARAAYALTDNIVKNVLHVDPMLKAIHSGEDASPMERALQPLIDQRDVLALIQTNLSKRLESVNNDLMTVQASNLKYLEKNRTLSKDIVTLGKQAEVTADKIEDPALKDRLETLRTKTREERRRYRIVKSLASGVVAGSGFDWASDDELRDIVLDDED